MNVFIKKASELILQRLIEADVESLIGAARYKRGEARQVWRNGYRIRELRTALGILILRVPKLRRGTYFPSFLKRPKTVEASVAVWLRAAAAGATSLRMLRDIVQAMDLRGIGPDQLLTIQAGLESDLRSLGSIRRLAARIEAHLTPILKDVQNAATTMTLGRAGGPVLTSSH